MLCNKPYLRGRVPYGCGQCLPCRINRRRQWSTRQELESLTHDENCFVTLTYAPEHIPRIGSLQPRDLQLFVKRLRQRAGSRRLRFFAVGEYGERGERPHYHLSVFGLSGYTLLDGSPAKLAHEVIKECWPAGFTLTGDFNIKTANYVCGYITKKMTAPNSYTDGRHPEFARMSNRPGIGAAAMIILAKQALASGHGLDLLEETGDVPPALVIGRKSLPLGRYLLSILRDAVGFTPEYVQILKDRQAYKSSTEMLMLLSTALETTPDISQRAAILYSTHQKRLQLTARHHIFSTGKSL